MISKRSAMRYLVALLLLAAVFGSMGGALSVFAQSNVPNLEASSAQSPSQQESPDVWAEWRWDNVETATWEEASVLVRFRDDVPVLARLSTLEQCHATVGIPIDAIRVWTIEVEAGTTASVLACLNDDPGVWFAEADVLAAGEMTPDDTYYASDQYAPAIIKADAAWDLTTGDPGVLIAVVDSGADFSHPDLQGTLIAGPDYVNDDSDPSDDMGHGTHVTGIVAASINNQMGIAGIAPESRILVVKVLDENNVASYSDLAQGIIYAADQGADIINVSVTGPVASQTLQSAVDYAWGQGALIVAAAGNTASSNPSFPAAYAHVVGVAATDHRDRSWSGSSYGAHVAIAAPGRAIWSTDWQGGAGPYASRSGTSMAAPHVSGVAALVLAQNSTLTHTQVRQVIEEHADDLGDAGHDPHFGHGRINAYQAVLNAGEPVSPTAMPTPTMMPTETPVPPTPTATPLPPTPVPPIPTATPGDSQALLVSSSSGGNVGFSFSDEDVLLQDDNWSSVLDLSALDITNDLNAIALLDAEQYLLSFNANGGTNVPGLGLVDDSDIVRLDAAQGEFFWYLDGSDVGLTTNGEDIDGLAILNDGALAISTVGTARVEGLAMADEDLLRFTPGQLGVDTSGSWAPYFDGSDVGLSSSRSEDVDGVWIDLQSGAIHLSTVGDFSVANLSGDGTDVFICLPGTLGSQTSCTFGSFWTGAANGFAGENVDALALTENSASVTSYFGSSDQSAPSTIESLDEDDINEDDDPGIESIDPGGTDPSTDGSDISLQQVLFIPFAVR